MLVPTGVDIDRAVRGYVKSALSMPVIAANANFPAPAGQYATALLIYEEKNGFNSNNFDYSPANDKINFISSSNHYLTYSIQIYRGDNANENARELSVYFGTPAGQFYLQKNNLTVIDWSIIRNLTTVIDGEMEQRSSIDIIFGVVVKNSQEIDRIVEVDVGIELNSAKNILDNININ